jgi:hypothetical protein
VPFFSVSVPNYVDFKARATSFACDGRGTWRAMNLTGSGEPRLIQVRTVTANFLATLGVRMARAATSPPRTIGRTARRSRSSSGRVLAAPLRRAAGRRSARTLQLDGEAYTVVGVTRSGLPLPGDIEIAVPMQADAPRDGRLNHELDVVRAPAARRVRSRRADASCRPIAAQIAPSLPVGERGWRTRLVPLARRHRRRSLRRTLVVLLGAVALLLLVACANLSNLLLVRVPARGFELAVPPRARRVARPARSRSCWSRAWSSPRSAASSVSSSRRGASTRCARCRSRGWRRSPSIRACWRWPSRRR